jgi:hypothetical protein
MHPDFSGSSLEAVAVVLPWDEKCMKMFKNVNQGAASPLRKDF